VEIGTHQSIFKSNPSWFNSSPENYGLIANTFFNWNITNPAPPINTFAVVTNNTKFRNYLLENYRGEYVDLKGIFYFDYLLVRFPNSPKIKEKDLIRPSSYKYSFVFTTNLEKIANKVLIPTPKWIDYFFDMWK
jgi:hypothetical protein